MLQRLPDLSRHPHIAEQANALRIADNARQNRYQVERRKRDPMFRVVNCMRNRIHLALKGIVKCKNTRGLIGCTLVELRAHLEKQFKPGMSWTNYGSWEVDHIRPCAAFDLRIPEEQWRCFHWSNLRPLWMLENRRKAAKILTKD